MAKQHLTTFDDVIDAIGGVNATAALCGRSAPNICQWRRRNDGKFPAAYWLLLRDELDHRGFTVSPAIFDFELPSRRRRPVRQKVNNAAA